MNPPKAKKSKKRQKKRKEGHGALVEELDLMSDVIFCLNLPQKVHRRATRFVKTSASSKVSISHIPISVTFRARRYPVCTSAFPKESDGETQPPLGDVDELLGWPTLHHTVSWIRGVHILDLNKVFKKSISREKMMKDVVARIGGRATLDLVFPPLSRANFIRTIQDEYEGSQAVVSLLEKGMKTEAEAVRKQEIVVMVDSRTRKSWGADRIVPVWFLIWVLEWDYLRPHFSTFNTKFGVCFQIADGMRCKMETGAGSNDTDRELLTQSRKVIKSMEIISNQGNLTLLQNRTRDLVAVDMACRRLFNRRQRPWRSENVKKSLAEAEEVLSGTSSSNGGGDSKNKDDSMSARVTDLEEAFDVEIITISSKMERLKSDIRMLALKFRVLDKQQKNSFSVSTPGVKIMPNDNNDGANDRPQQRFLSSYDSDEGEDEEEEEDDYADLDYSTSGSSGEEAAKDDASSSSSSSEPQEEEEELTEQRKRPRWVKRQQQQQYSTKTTKNQSKRQKLCYPI